MGEPAQFLTLAEEMAGRAAEDPGYAALAILAAHAALEALVNRLGGEGIESFNYRARFLPKWHDLCERTLGQQLEAAPDLERLHALRDALLGSRGEPERLDRRSSAPPPEVPAGRFGAEEAWWAVETARGVIVQFYRASGRELPVWL
jgi:hypothetical protein